MKLIWLKLSIPEHVVMVKLTCTHAFHFPFVRNVNNFAIFLLCTCYIPNVAKRSIWD